MTNSVWFDGVDQLNSLSADLRGAGLAAAPLMRLAVAKTAADIEADAKAFVPVDTGNLKASIGREMHGNAYYAEAVIGPTAAYGHYVEFGTSEHAPQAYMGPAFDRRAIYLEQALGQIRDRTLGGA